MSPSMHAIKNQLCTFFCTVFEKFVVGFKQLTAI